MNAHQAAEAFAALWYSRLPEGRDEATLAFLLGSMLVDHEAQVRIEERRNIVDKFASMIVGPR